MGKKLLIDAISTSSGGAISHLDTILSYFDEQNFFSEVEVHLPYKTMIQMPKNKKIYYVYNRFFERFLLLRILWQVVYLNLLIYFKKFNCIFVTGSSHLLFADNIVTISQNLLPFSKKEVDRYFFSIFFIKLKILNFTQKISFKLSKGIIFLHQFSKTKIVSQVPNIRKIKSKIIGHSINLNFKAIKYKKLDKFRLIYVSNVDYYKNQIFLIEAINDLFIKKPYLKKKIIVEFYGGNYPKALRDMNDKISSITNGDKNFKYLGLVKKKKIFQVRKNYNTISLFASSCENFSVSVLETMSLRIPTLCVNLQPMKSVLGSFGFYYKYKSVKSFQEQLLRIINNYDYVKRKTLKPIKNFEKYNPSLMAFKTYKFLNKIGR